MITKNTQSKIEIDARGKKLGRLASEVAVFLMGKKSPSWRKDRAENISVVIKNASKIAISEKKRQGKVYSRYSGYPGGLKHESLGNLLARKGIGEVLMMSVRKMIPNNRLRNIRMKRLIIEQ